MKSFTVILEVPVHIKYIGSKRKAKRLVSDLVFTSFPIEGGDSTGARLKTGRVIYKK